MAGVGSLALVAGVAVAFGPFAPAASATVATSIGDYFTVVDSGGVNDENGGAQLELTQMGRNDTELNGTNGYYQIFWSWDATDFAGQTGDACALFDSNADGNVDVNVCAQVHNSDPKDPSSPVVQTSVSPTAHTCGDTDPRKCTNPNVDVTLSSGLVAGPIADITNHGGNLVTPTDPFAGQPGAANPPNDSTIAVRIPEASLPHGAQLINVCSYESIALGGINNPNDCIAPSGGGFLSIVKHTTGGDGVFDFAVTPGGVSRSVTTSAGSGTAQAVATATGSNHAVAETVPSGWSLTSASCTLQGGGSTGTFSAAHNRIDGVSVQSGSITTCTFTNTKGAPALTLHKTSSDTSYDHVGQVLHYSYLLTNSGNVPLAPPYAVADDKTAVSCPQTPDPLPANGTLACTATYTVTQADLNAGHVTNLATATAAFGGDTITSNEDSVTIRAAQGPALTLAKSSPDTSYDYVGQVLHYSYLLTNSGNVTLSAPYAVADDRTAVSCPTAPAALHPGDSVTCTATYAVTQADLDAGHVTNVATATAMHGGDTVTSNEDSVTIPAAQGPALRLHKASAEASYDRVGQVLHYTYRLTNTGNTTLTSPFAVTDDRISSDNIDCSGATSPLAVGASTACSATYTVRQADLDAGSVTNHATATAHAGDKTITSNQAQATVTAARSPGMALVKSVDRNSAAYGDTLTYTLKATNTGNVALSRVVVTDVVPNGTAYVAGSASPNATFDAASHTIRWDVGTLAAGASAGGLTFKVSIDRPAHDPAVGLPATTIDNVGAVEAASVAKAPSNRVRTTVDAVLGVTVVKPAATPTARPAPAATPEPVHEARQLPFTGLPIPVQVAVWSALLMIGAGAVLTSVRRRRKA